MIYFILAKELNRIKIGYCAEDKFHIRYCQLRVSSPTRLTVSGLLPGGTRLMEQQLHLTFKDLRVIGEWFEAEKQLLDYIENDSNILKVITTIREKEEKFKDFKEKKKSLKDISELNPDLRESDPPIDLINFENLADKDDNFRISNIKKFQ